MIPFFTPELLSSVATRPAKIPLALLCLSTDWGMQEEQSLALAASLHDGAHAVTLVVTLGSVLHEKAQARRRPCHPLPVSWKHISLWKARGLVHWLQQQQISILVTTRVADLNLASLTKTWSREELRLVYRQLEPLAPVHNFSTWRAARQVSSVDAWLAPTPRLARRVLAHTHLELRRVWVVPPILLPNVRHQGHGIHTTARHLLNLPERATLIGVLDCGGNGSAFAIEALYRMRQEHGSTAELVLMGGPATPPEIGRWAQFRELAKQLNLSHCVHLRPLHNAATPTLFYRAMDALLLPCPGDATGLHLLRAMSSRCPLVSVAAADALDLLEAQRTGRLFEQNDVAACAQALCTTLAALGPARRMAQRAANLVERQCSPRQQGHQVEAIIEYIGQHEALA